MISKEATNTNVIVFSLTWFDLTVDQTNLHIQNEHGNYYTIEVLI
jgi:hypothetical protein